MNHFIKEYRIDYIEIYTPMAKAVAYWHVHALGFRLVAYGDMETGLPGLVSYVLCSGAIRLVLTSTYPTLRGAVNLEVGNFITVNSCGVKRIALDVPDAKSVFEDSISNGAFPIKYPHEIKDADGEIEESAIKIFDWSEIVFVDRSAYRGVFKPGYVAVDSNQRSQMELFSSVDHIAAEVRINEGLYWSQYLEKSIGIKPVQDILSGPENLTGMALRVNQTPDGNLTMVIAEPESYLKRSKVQANLENFGPGIHHLAFSTDNLLETVGILKDRGVEFVKFPSSYYDLLRADLQLSDLDIDDLQEKGVIVDVEDSAFLFQKFIKPIGDRPFFFYEIVQRVNDYRGFALKNINVLKRAEEIEIMGKVLLVCK